MIIFKKRFKENIVKRISFLKKYLQCLQNICKFTQELSLPLSTLCNRVVLTNAPPHKTEQCFTELCIFLFRHKMKNISLQDILCVVFIKPQYIFVILSKPLTPDSFFS